jgi:hypothetical protein
LLFIICVNSSVLHYSHFSLQMRKCFSRRKMSSTCALGRLLRLANVSLNQVRRLNEPSGPYRVDGPLRSAKKCSFYLVLDDWNKKQLLAVRATLADHVTALHAQEPSEMWIVRNEKPQCNEH